MEAWKRLEGQVVDGTFQLSDYLGGSPDSAVFLTSISGEPPQLAAIKLIPEDLPHAQERLACWRFASTLFHPNLIQIFQAGHGTVAGKKYLYAVMEYAEENLGQIVPQRVLTEEEVSMLLVPTLNALEYLHANGLVHGHIKPSDIMAMGDRLKVSMDGVRKPGEAIDMAGAAAGAGANGASGRNQYDPPEATSTAAGDVWSLGVTLVEVMTQRKPQWDPRTQTDPVVPENLPGSLRDIARNCLRRDPKRRWTIAGIGMRLRAPLDNPLDGYAGGVQVAGAAGAAGAGAHEVAVGAAAGVSAPVAGTYAEVTLPERVDVGVRGEVAGARVTTNAGGAAATSAADLAGGAGAPAVTAGGVSVAARTAPVRDIAQDLRMAAGDTTAGLRATLAESSASVNAEAEHSSRGYLALAVVVFLVVAGLLGFKLLHPTPKATGETAQTAAAEQPVQQSEAPAQNAPGTNGALQNAATSGGAAGQGAATKSAGQNATATQGGAQSAAPSGGGTNQSSAPAGNGANAVPANANNANAPVNSAATRGVQGSEGAAGSGVVHQVIPEASEKSLSTIYGAVRVGIKVTAGASGEVADATIDSEGPSTYFANLSLAAARQWKFAGSGSWELRFEFRNDGAKVFAEKSGG